MDLYCVFCMHVRPTEPLRAITVLQGQAVCYDHAYYAQGEPFNTILAVIKRDEVKPSKS